MNLPKVVPLELIQERLPLIFPGGLEHRGYAVREVAAKVVFTMLYGGAIEGSDRWLRPNQITDMSDAQAALSDDASREAWAVSSLSSKKWRVADPWYANNSREQVRDETIRTAFMAMGAVIERPGLAPTSSKPRYALASDFAGLFDDALTDEALEAAIEAWQKKHLSPSALVRLQLVKHGVASAADAILVTFPGQTQTRELKPGASSVITKAVVEIFAPNFLKDPGVLWISESGNKVVARDDAVLKSLKINIDPSKTLPDIILIDKDAADGEVLIVFVEVVATDGPVTSARKKALSKIGADAGFTAKHMAFVTAYADRGSAVFRKGVSEIAWGSYIWCVSEPNQLIEMRDELGQKIKGG